MLISVTRMRLNNWRSIFAFYHLISSIKNQMSQAHGLIKFRLSGLTTLTLWENKQAMQDFRNTDAHMEAMRQARRIARWVISENYEGDALPSLKEADQRLRRIQSERGLNSSYWMPF